MELATEDLEYAHRDVDRPRAAAFGDREWEREVAATSPDLWMILMDQLYYGDGGADVENGLEQNTRALRVLTLPFASAFSANGGLPIVREIDFDAVYELYGLWTRAETALPELVRDAVAVLSNALPALGRAFQEALADAELPPLKKAFVCASVLVLLASFDLDAAVTTPREMTLRST